MCPREWSKVAGIPKPKPSREKRPFAHDLAKALSHDSKNCPIVAWHIFCTEADHKDQVFFLFSSVHAMKQSPECWTLVHAHGGIGICMVDQIYYTY